MVEILERQWTTGSEYCSRTSRHCTIMAAMVMVGMECVLYTSCVESASQSVAMQCNRLMVKCLTRGRIYAA